MNKEYVAVAEQTIFDVALQHYGSIEGIVFLLKDNPDIIGDNELFVFRETYKIRDTVINPRVVAAYAGYVPVTEGNNDAQSAILIDENGEYLIDENNETPVGFF